MELPEEVCLILNQLNKNGYEAFIVGGCVRDSLLGKKPTDFDIATSASPHNVKVLFKRTVDTGIRHGTVTVLIGKCSVEVTTYRIDGEYIDNRHPENVVFTSELKDDLMRRDFTINAMAYHPKLGYVDYHDGKSDLINKIIRGVGDPKIRFEEDALRMLRGIRFAAALGFEVEYSTKEAIFEKAPLIKNISSERIRDEFLKIITAPFPTALETLTDSKLLYYYSSELHEYCEKNITQIITSLTKSEKNLVYCLVIFFMYARPELIETTLLKLRIDKKTAKEVMMLCIWFNKPVPKNKYETRKALSAIGIESFKKLITLKQTVTGENLSLNYDMLKSVISNGDCFTLKELAINGSDLIVLGAKSIEIGSMLAELLNLVMENPEINKKDILLEKAKKLIQRGI